jgi:type IV secretion system protein VirB5
MKSKKTILMISMLVTNGQANAGSPVFDVTNFGQMIQQVQQGAQQVQQGVQELAGQANQLIELKNQVMNQVTQIQQLKDQLLNLSNVSGIGDLANIGGTVQNFAAMPDKIDNLVSFQASSTIATANKVIDLADTTINPSSTTGKIFTEERQQSAINVAALRSMYTAADTRIADLQLMLNQVERSPSAKNIADLQARMQAEQIFLQNENNQLVAWGQMQQAKKDIAQQKEQEARLQVSKNHTNHQW